MVIIMPKVVGGSAILPCPQAPVLLDLNRTKRERERERDEVVVVINGKVISTGC